MEKQNRTRPVPKGVQKLLDLVNELPTELKYFPLAVDETEVGLVSTEFSEYVETLSKPIREFIGPFDLKTRMTLAWIEPRRSKGYSPDKTMRAAYNRYTSLVSARDALRFLATFNNWNNDFDRNVIPFNPVEMTVAVTLRADEAGVFKVVSNEVIDGLLDHHMEAHRIRECPICKNLYWAGRRTRLTCSMECGNTLRQRRWRETYSEESKMCRYYNARKVSRSLTDVATSKGRK
jgi:hypothetical protein